MENNVPFYSFPYQLAGFTSEDWESMPRGDRVITRDYYLNGMDSDRTLIFGDFETRYQVRKAEIRYKLDERPRIEIKLTDFVLPTY